MSAGFKLRKKNLFHLWPLMTGAALLWTSSFASSQPASQEVSQEDSIAFTLNILKEALRGTYLRIEGPHPTTQLQRACANVVFLEYTSAYLRELQDPDWTKNSGYSRPLQTQGIEGSLQDFAGYLAAVQSDTASIESGGIGTINLLRTEISRLRKENQWPGSEAIQSRFSLESFMQSDLNANLLECRRGDLISHLLPEIRKLPKGKQTPRRYEGGFSQSPNGGIKISIQRKL
jgi:hypothetical protein